MLMALTDKQRMVEMCESQFRCVWRYCSQAIITRRMQPLRYSVRDALWLLVPDIHSRKKPVVDREAIRALFATRARVAARHARMRFGNTLRLRQVSRRPEGRPGGHDQQEPPSRKVLARSPRFESWPRSSP